VTRRRLLEREKLRRVFASGNDFEKRTDQVREAAKSRTGVGNLVNPMTGCRVQQTCRPSRSRSSDQDLCGESRRSREERQGRNDPGTWQSRDEAWATVQVGVDAETVMSVKGPR